MRHVARCPRRIKNIWCSRQCDPRHGAENHPPVEKPSGLTSIRNAKTVYLVNQSTDFVVFGHLPEKLKQWGRWTIVEHPEDADLLLVFSATYDERSLIAVDRISQRQLMGVNYDRRMPAQTAGVLVNRMRKQIDKPGDTQ